MSDKPDACGARTDSLERFGEIYEWLAANAKDWRPIAQRIALAEAKVRELEQALELIASFAGKTLIGPYEMGSEEMRAYTTGANRAYEECAALAALHVTDKAVKNG